MTSPNISLSQKPKEEFYSKSKSCEWYTPPWILMRAGAVLGHFHDPALPGKTDGLTSIWGKSVFLNPPYGHGVKKWFEKLRDSVYQKNTEEYIVLWKCAPETEAWGVLMVYTDLVAFPKQRIHFIDGKTGMATNRATFPSALFYHGENADLFKSQFNECSIWTEERA